MLDFNAFTIESKGLARVLSTTCKISEAISIKELNEGKPHPTMYDFVAIWDTGASSSAISQKVVDKLNLIPTGRGISKTAGGAINVQTYSVNIMLPMNVGFSSLQVSCNKMEPDILIGMDIISQGDFSLTNKDGKTLFSFQTPSSHRVDYVEEINYNKAHTPIVNPVKIGRNDPCPCNSGKKYKICCGKNK